MARVCGCRGGLAVCVRARGVARRGAARGRAVPRAPRGAGPGRAAPLARGQARQAAWRPQADQHALLLLTAPFLHAQGKTVMLDCGIHPGYSGMASLPFFDEVDLDKVDVCLVTHFHLDHCAAVPYLLSRTNFKGRVFMTHPTK